jgi:hypothetical protein
MKKLYRQEDPNLGDILYRNEDPAFGDVPSYWYKNELLKYLGLKTIEEVLEKYELYEVTEEEEMRMLQKGELI